MGRGWTVGQRANTTLALGARERANGALQWCDGRYVEMIIHFEQDAVCTGCGWTAQLRPEDGVRLSCALRGAQDNPEIESFTSRFKEENRSPFLYA
jgi:hypothetical protein